MKVTRTTVLIMVVLAVLAALLVPAQAREGKPARRSFTARGYPYPQVLSGGCKTGVEGLTYAAVEFDPPSDGALVVKMSRFSGNWDLTIYDAKSGEELVNAWEGGWNGNPPKEEASVYLDAGRSVEITACNFLSSQFEVKVDYTFYPGASDNTSDPAGGTTDAEEDCLEVVPEQVSQTDVTDDGDEVVLDVLVLLDHVRRPEAVDAFEIVAEAYAPLDIVVRPTFRKIRGLPSRDTSLSSVELIEASREDVGGQRPAGIDVVYTLTTREFSDGPAGRADCIGGIRYPTRAFAVGVHRVESEYAQEIPPLTLLKYRSAKVATHEIGHLLGAHHHYSNCAEGDHSDPTDDVGGECTVMSPDVFFVSTRFGTLEGAVVRGHALEYAGD